jgi:hypothetical protein
MEIGGPLVIEYEALVKLDSYGIEVPAVRTRPSTLHTPTSAAVGVHVYDELVAYGRTNTHEGEASQ